MEGNRPLNIRGRTGLAGRGVLGKYVMKLQLLADLFSMKGIIFIAKYDLFSPRWGPNHAADPIVTIV